MIATTMEKNGQATDAEVAAAVGPAVELPTARVNSSGHVVKPLELLAVSRRRAVIVTKKLVVQRRQAVEAAVVAGTLPASVCQIRLSMSHP